LSSQGSQVQTLKPSASGSCSIEYNRQAANSNYNRQAVDFTREEEVENTPVMHRHASARKEYSFSRDGGHSSSAD